ncbi:Glyoxalase/Bleomycin resistance protein/Dioxygenase superfamily protein [Maioricimonas rarisocia]|uniref:Glyoxalase/Bleomycin resistance protein/Dioxygenase superfamily protein n=1 Tax=Maioricimonas rarisocia TaxID=2528026 RepID=A0A517ZD94_9PLAN|nr:VOC family protein [Maioricimonas rarisocia]QDU40463.1 Glyoxalase/Bleomycin resistance protein/Dioxygenase superfamily protein [Maioricimonas rarisocia]
MKIRLISLFVEDQEKALAFYTETLGFDKRRDIPVGDARFLTVGAPDDLLGPELLLEPNANPAAKTFQQAMYQQGIPAAAFDAGAVLGEYQRLQGLGVRFMQPPTKMGPMTQAVFDDTVGNLIQIYGI